MQHAAELLGCTQTFVMFNPPAQVLHRALLGLLLIHRAHRQPADLLQPPQGSCHPCHLAAFHLVYETMCTAARLSDPGGSDGCIDRSWELPPLAVLYGAVAHLPPECLVLASSPMRGFEPPEPSSGAPFPRLSPQHLSLVVQVRTGVQCHTGVCLCLGFLHRTEPHGQRPRRLLRTKSTSSCRVAPCLSTTLA